MVRAFKDFPEENQVSFTRGQDLTVGSIAVPDKQFTLQAQNELGWVVNSFTLFKGVTNICFQTVLSKMRINMMRMNMVRINIRTHDHES